jgi:hypothetical protein
MTCPTCGTTAWIVKDDNGVVDPDNGDRVEYCECENGHSFTNVLHA